MPASPRCLSPHRWPQHYQFRLCLVSAHFVCPLICHWYCSSFCFFSHHSIWTQARLDFGFAQSWHIRKVSFSWQKAWNALRRDLFLKFYIEHCWLSISSGKKTPTNKTEHRKKKKRNTQTFFFFPFSIFSLSQLWNGFREVSFSSFSFSFLFSFLCTELAMMRHPFDLFVFKHFFVGFFLDQPPLSSSTCYIPRNEFWWRAVGSPF